MKASADKVAARLRAARVQAETEKEWAWAHTKETAAERDLLIYALTRHYPAHLMRSTNAKKQVVVCVHAPSGQLAWHLPEAIVPLFAHLQMTANDWDGHTTKERQMRILQLPLDIQSSPVVSAAPAKP